MTTLHEAKQLRISGQYADALLLLQTSFSSPFPSNIAIEIATCYQALGQVNKAIEAISDSIQEHAQDAQLYRKLYALEASNSNWVRAEDIATKLIELEDAPEDYFRKGRALSWQNRINSALSTFKKGLTLKTGLSFTGLLVQLHKVLEPLI